MAFRVADWLGLLLVVAIIYVLVRPQSKAAELVDAVMDMLTSLVRGATGLTNTG
jgi:preprotein translocase subunit YajC